MDPRSASTDALASMDTDLDALESTPAQQQPAMYARIHAALTSALAETDVDGATPPAQQPGG